MRYQAQQATWSAVNWRLFLALSRTQHGLLDLAAPAVAALLSLGGFPALPVSMLGLITAFAGYTAVYALNDLVDVANDRAKMAFADPMDRRKYLDATGVRHPLAQGMITAPAALAWTAFWTAIALAGAWALNPICLMLFLLGAGLEVFYCLLLRVTALRTLVSGLVKTVGGIAAVFAVDSSPSPWFLLALWAWLFCWEIGGQNIPADWHDIVEDRQLGARTLPVVFGPSRAGALIIVSLAAASLLSLAVLALAPIRTSWQLLMAALAIGAYLLLMPATKLWRLQTDENATRLFNRASYYPVSMLALVLSALALQAIG